MTVTQPDMHCWKASDAAAVVGVVGGDYNITNPQVAAGVAVVKPPDKRREGVSFKMGEQA